MITKAQLNFIKTYNPVMYGYGQGEEPIGYVVGRALRAMGAGRPGADDIQPLIDAVLGNGTLGDRTNSRILSTYTGKKAFTVGLYQGFDEPMMWNEANVLRIRYNMPAYI